METKKQALVLRLLTEKCPNCGKGPIFVKKGSPFTFPEMRTHCEVCGYRYEREPGYFLGAMYLSYGLAVLEGILTFLTCYFFFPRVPTLLVCFIILAVIFLLSFRNFRLSRVLYMYIFPN